MTPIDEAHLKAEATGTDEARLAFYERLAEAELHLLLDSSDGTTMSPRLLEFEGSRYAFAFDLPDRLEAFAGAAATATLSGRQLARMLSSERLGLALNLEDAPSAQLLPPDAIAWLLRTLSHAPAEQERRISTITPPGNLPELLLVALDSKLRLAAGLARQAYLVGVTYTDGSRSHILGIVDAIPGAEPDLARAVSEALIFSGLDAGSLDVTFLRASQPFAARLARLGLRIDLPDAPTAGPVRDPDAPPRLR